MHTLDRECHLTLCPGTRWYCHNRSQRRAQSTIPVTLTKWKYVYDNRMAWQWAETLVEIRETLADIRGTTKLGCRCHFPKHEFNRPVCLEAHHYFWHIFHSSGFHHICNIKCRLDCRYSPQNIFNAKNFNPHNKPISLLNVPICTQGMQRTWWPKVDTIIVTGPYWVWHIG